MLWTYNFTFWLVYSHIQFLNFLIFSVCCAYIFVELIDCILVSLLARNALFLTFSVIILCFMFLNLCCNYSISLLFLTSSLWFRFILTTSSLFFSRGLFYFQVEYLLDNSKIKKNLNLSVCYLTHSFFTFCLFIFFTTIY